MLQKYLLIGICVAAAHLASVDSKPVTKEQLPLAIELVGSINGKTFYLEKTTLRSQSDGRAYCTSFGMKLAKFENQGELDFINSNLAADTDYLWTDGELVLSSSSFFWNQGGGIDPNMLIESGNSVGLTVRQDWEGTGQAKLHPSAQEEEHIVLCYI